MAANVLANGREIAAKKSGNKSIAAMPDVCMSPPPPPAGPVPVPYPNFSDSSDTDDGSKSVLIGGKMAMLKNASAYKTSKGNEPATNNFGANVVTHKLQGKTKFAAWSFDVQFEGQNVVRLLDLTTHNHASPPGGAVTNSTGDAVAFDAMEDCKALAARNKAEREAQGKRSARKTERDLVPRGKKKTLPKVPNAIVHAATSIPGAGNWTVFGASHRSSLSAKRNRGARAIRPKKSGRKLLSRNICPDKPFDYSARLRHHCHAEAKVLESVMSAAKRAKAVRPSVVLAIDWLSSAVQDEGKTPGSPCDDCEELIRHAKECIDIKICDEKGKAVPL